MNIDEIKKHNRKIREMNRRNEKKLGMTFSKPEVEPEEEGICSVCHQDLEPIYENNGFTEPEGPSKWEISGYKPCNCQEAEEEEYDER